MLPFDAVVAELQSRGFRYVPTNDPGATTLVELGGHSIPALVTLPMGIGDSLPDRVVQKALSDTKIDFANFRAAVLSRAGASVPPPQRPAPPTAG